jgi:hypothetical protein
MRGETSFPARGSSRDPVPHGALGEPDRATSSRKESWVIQIVAKLRRVAAFTAVLASLSVVSPGASRAQAPTPAPAAAAPKAGKAAKAPKSPKVRKPKVPKVEKPYAERRKEDGVYAKGANWLQLRFGYANRTGDLSGDGSLGYGVAYTHMLSNRAAFAAGIGRDVVGHFANQIDEAVPITGEFQRFFKMGGEMRPYIGVGGGFYFRKFYRTGSEYNTTTTGGGHVSLGLTSQIDDKHVIGFETRVAWLAGRPGVVNPTFGPGQSTETIWTAKLTWALVY